MIRKYPGPLPAAFFLALRLPRGSVQKNSFGAAMLMLIVALRLLVPLPCPAATPDRVLEWICVINNAVLLPGGTTPAANPVAWVRTGCQRSGFDEQSTPSIHGFQSAAM